MPTTHAPRSYFRSVRLTRGELSSLRARAHAAGLTVSEFLRRVAFGQAIRARRNHLDRDAIYHLSKIGTDLNQLTRVANTTGQLVALELIEPVLEAVRRAIDELGD